MWIKTGTMAIYSRKKKKKKTQYIPTVVQIKPIRWKLHVETPTTFCSEDLNIHRHPIPVKIPNCENYKEVTGTDGHFEVFHQDFTRQTKLNLQKRVLNNVSLPRLKFFTIASLSLSHVYNKSWFIFKRTHEQSYSSNINKHLSISNINIT